MTYQWPFYQQRYSNTLGKANILDKFEDKAYEDKTLCVIVCLKEYISRRNKYKGLTTDQLIIIHRKPFKGASIDTMRRWVKDTFMINNIVSFSPHCCWAASSSKAKHIDVNIDEITRRGCWKNRKNFLKFYDKEITEYASEDIDFVELIIMYDFYILLLINWSWIIISWDDPIHPSYWFTYLKLLISSALKSHFYTRNWQSKNECKN